MPPKPNERQYRMVTAPLRVRSDAAASDKRIQSDYYVEGYASTFNDPYTLFECSGVEYKEIVSPDAFSETDMSDVILQYNHEGKVLARMSNGTPYTLFECSGVEYKEIVSPDAFSETDMSDVILQYNHEGKVLARMSNGTLIVEPDEHGLFVAADLSGCQASRELYEEIKSGLVTRMSWGFTISASEYDRDTHTETLTKIKKIYDVSAVSIPADPNTEISARNLLDGEIERARAECARNRNKMALAVARAKLAVINGRKVM